MSLLPDNVPSANASGATSEVAAITASDARNCHFLHQLAEAYAFRSFRFNHIKWFQHQNTMSLPGIELGPRPSQGRVRIRNTLRTELSKCLAEESILVLQYRTLPCLSGTLAKHLYSGSPSRSRTWPYSLGNRCALQNTYGPQNIPTWIRTRARTFGGSDANPLHHRDSISLKSRRLDWRQHEPVYKTGAFLSRATSALLAPTPP